MGVISRSKPIWELHGVQIATLNMDHVLGSVLGMKDTEVNKMHRCIKPSLMQLDFSLCLKHSSG